MSSVMVQRPATTGTERQYLRGSTLLLAGRFISIFLNLAVQVVTVRYLAKADYGAFAYALAAASMGSSLIHLGMDKALPRLIPIYRENGDHARAFGSIALATATIWGLGICIVVAAFGLRGVLADSVVTDPQSLSLLLILLVLAPVNAYTTVLEKLVAVFASARAIFFRRHVLGPGIKLAAVLAVVFTAGDVYMLAYGYLVGGLIGIGLYVMVLIRVWREQGLLRYLTPAGLTLPVREMFGFSLPLQMGTLILILRTSLVVLLLGYLGTTSAVAEFRAVLSIAGLNLLVYEAFRLLFVPHASALFARVERVRIGELFWTTSVWITVLTFPVFALTSVLAEPLTVLLFGSTYAGAGILLAVLAFGHYVHAALGFNSAALTVHGKLRFVVGSDVLAGIAVVALTLWLVPRFGALGAALSTTGSMLVHNAASHVSLHLAGTGVRLLEWRFVRVHACALLVFLGLLAIQILAAPPLALVLAAAAAASVMLLRLSRGVLRADSTFPELLRIPLLRQLLA